MRRVAVYAGTRNLYGCMETAAKSLLAHTAMDRVVFLIEDEAFPRPLPPVIDCVNCSGQGFFPETGPNYHSAWTYMSLMRLALPELLPEESRALYLDVDTIVTGDLGPLFSASLGGCPVAGVREPSRSRGVPYYNAGVLLMDLFALRGLLCKRLIDTVNARRLIFPDQDALNLTLAGAIQELSPIWNSSPWTAQPPGARIIHFAADRNYATRPLFMRWAAKPWRDVYAGKIGP